MKKLLDWFSKAKVIWGMGAIIFVLISTLYYAKLNIDTLVEENEKLKAKTTTMQSEIEKLENTIKNNYDVLINSYIRSIHEWMWKQERIGD